MNINNLNIDRIIKNFEVLKKKQANNELIVQHKSYGEWKESLINDVNYDISNIRIITLYDAELRIKPEPQYRPYPEVKEEWLNRGVIEIDTGIEYSIAALNYKSKKVCAEDWYSLEEMYKIYNWSDGKPFGDVVE